MRRSQIILLSGLASGSAASVLLQRGANHGSYKHVFVVSVDGLHNSDIDKYVALGPSNISQLLSTGYRYTNANTSWPSDSFPGTMAQFTGSSPRTHGVWYDDTWDRSLYPPASNCSGAPGAEIIFDESIDYNDTFVFSGGIDPANLPKIKSGSSCSPLYPHSRPRVNTVWEAPVVGGLVTAYTDKHPAYDIVRGPSGTGLTTGYFPEINTALGSTDNVSACIKYDTLHVNAWLSWLDGQDPANAEGSLGGKVPNLFGGNFQSVSVGQKTKGYVAGSLAFSADLKAAIDFVDASLGKVVAKLKAKNIYDDTLIIVASKHGQSPIDPTKFREIDPKNLTNYIGVDTDQITADDTALIFLSKQSDLATAVKNLQAHASALAISQLIYGPDLIARGFGDPSKDPAVPDIIIQPELGIIYTTSKSKIAEHGGGSVDDRHVACFASNPKIKGQVFSDAVETKQVGPAILKALGLPLNALKGANAEGTKALEGFCG